MVGDNTLTIIPKGQMMKSIEETLMEVQNDPTTLHEIGKIALSVYEDPESSESQKNNSEYILRLIALRVRYVYKENL